jgi:hypothetical protein
MPWLWVVTGDVFQYAAHIAARLMQGEGIVLGGQQVTVDAPALHLTLFLGNLGVMTTDELQVRVLQVLHGSWEVFKLPKHKYDPGKEQDMRQVWHCLAKAQVVPSGTSKLVAFMACAVWSSYAAHNLSRAYIWVLAAGSNG